MDVLVISPRAAEAINAHALEGYPHEVCGVMLGWLSDSLRVRRVAEAHAATNLDTERAADRYDLDPFQYQRIEQHAAKHGLEVVGIYHSHPDHPSCPSETDRQRAVEVWQATRSWSYVILEVTTRGVASWRSWVLENEAFSEEPIEVAGTDMLSGAGELQ